MLCLSLSSGWLAGLVPRGQAVLDDEFVEGAAELGLLAAWPSLPDSQRPRGDRPTPG